MLEKVISMIDKTTSLGKTVQTSMNDCTKEVAVFVSSFGEFVDKDVVKTLRRFRYSEERTERSCSIVHTPIGELLTHFQYLTQLF